METIVDYTLHLATNDGQLLPYNYASLLDVYPEIVRGPGKKDYDGYKGHLTVHLDLSKHAVLTLMELSSITEIDRRSSDPLSELSRVSRYNVPLDPPLVDYARVDMLLYELIKVPHYKRIVFLVVDYLIREISDDTLISLWKLTKRIGHPKENKCTIRVNLQLWLLVTYKFVEDLSSSIDFFRLSTEEFEKIISSDEVHTVDEEVVAAVGLEKGVNSRERMKRDQIVTLGGLVNKTQHIVDAAVFNELLKRDNSWSRLPLMGMPHRLAYYAAIELNGDLYVLGGTSIVPGDDRNGEPNSKKVWRYDHNAKRWRHCAEMHDRRANMENMVVVLDGKIYVFGGNEQFQRRHSSAECYDPTQDKWTLLPEMPNARADGAACVVDGRIYVSGGLAARSALSEIDVFVPVEREWRSAGQLPKSMSGHVMYSPDELHLIVMGGWTGIERMNDVIKRVACSREEWRTDMAMLTPRSAFSLIRLPSQQLLVFGGNDGKGAYAERFDGCSWCVVSSGEYEREGARVVLLRDAAHRLEELKKMGASH